MCKLMDFSKTPLYSGFTELWGCSRSYTSLPLWPYMHTTGPLVHGHSFQLKQLVPEDMGLTNKC